ncbi:hypothetical protein COCVIDRAFT_27074 [Bipolaris victoriae FI3]|uniref:Uncharacterized protein n=1 Tax=Bipolaris victoriae (strain FI3) TaxID=930091 RepID=W7EEJ4_BIPV3|nr:hypothetical protein COCVIDRAFT_27074 [Bipolaris victoriae FI3]
MKLSSIVGMAMLANAIEASVIDVEHRSPSSIEVTKPFPITLQDMHLIPFQARDVQCKAPGAHKCAVIVWVLMASFGIPGSSTTGRGVKVVGGNCDNIIANGKLKAEGGGNGWSADFTTTYGPNLYFGAYNIGTRTISGVRFQYNGRSYTQGDCFGTGGSNYDAIQCNFDC